MMATAQAAKAERTIVVCGIPEGCLKEDLMTDILMIHFQKRKNKGADVEMVIYPTSTRGVAYVTFEDEQVAENVLMKDEHILEDRRLRRAYPLKVSSYGGSIFTCVTCDLDLSTFGEKAVLEELVEDLKKNLTTLSFGPLKPSGQIMVQGPFPGIRTLQRMLLLKVKHALSGQDAKRTERALDHRLNNTSRSSKARFPLESSDLVQQYGKEGLTIVTDTDIYSYMKKYKSKRYNKSLKQLGVASCECVDGEVTTIHLDNDDTRPGPSRLKEAKMKVESLLAELQDSLRKKSFYVEGFDRAEKLRCQQACETVKTQFPHVLVIGYPTHIDIIGSSSDIYSFGQEMNKTMGNVQKEPWR
ncbi:hypothetical protein lerEdw1_006715 [Lerista edwardsae]|nr:hypothetical protein lerEdw1_006715 [Lerista edwardsae]